jgi:hypothetical protein
VNVHSPPFSYLHRILHAMASTTIQIFNRLKFHVRFTSPNWAWVELPPHARDLLLLRDGPRWILASDGVTEPRRSEERV